MTLLFFQNIISPHQMPYIQHLPKMEGVEQVVVIVPEVNLEERDSLGWNTEKWLQTEGIRFLVAPTEEEVERVLKVNETLRYETLRYETRSYETLRYENVNQNQNQNGDGNVLCKQSEQARANVNETPTLRKATGRRTKFGNDADATKTIDGNGNHNENQNQNEKVTWCLFSGINAFPEVAKWFRMSLKYNVRRGVITEPPYVYDHPLWQHAIRFALKDWRYVKYIDKIFVMGEDYLSYYRFWSKRWEVIPFMYCTEGNVLCKQSEQARANGNVNVNETLTLRKATGRRTKFGNDTALRNVACGYYENQNQNQKENGNGNGNGYETLRYETLRYENENQNQNQNQNGNGNDNETLRYENESENQNQNGNGNVNEERVRVVYVGSLSRRKNVQCLLKACMLLSQEEQEQLEIGIVGDGEQRTELERMSRNAIADIHFEGSIPMEKVPAVMEQYDILVLPSLHDGWGAVVNEALTLGLYVICSDHCGAKMLLKHSDNGRVFKNNRPSDLSIQLKNCLKKKEWIRSKAIDRFNWSMRHISGIAVANHFLSCLKHFKNE